MFCQNCGDQIIDGAKFCQKCGTKTPEQNAVWQEAVSAYAQPSGAQEEPAKKKVRKLPFVLGGAVLLIGAAVLMIVRFWNGSADYVETVKGHEPFASSQGLPYTYGEVLDECIDSPRWRVEDESGDTASVEISGKLKGTDTELVITVTVEPDADDPDLARIRPKSVSVDGKRYSMRDDAAVKILLAMFTAYDRGGRDLDELLAAAVLPEEPGAGKPDAGGKPDSAKPDADRTEEDSRKQPDGGLGEYTREQAVAAYQDILDLYYYGFLRQWADYEPAGLEVSYMWYQYKEGSLSEAGYQFADVDGDGVPELLVSLIEESWGSGDGMIYDMYALRDGKVVQLLSSAERDRYYLCDNGIIANEGSGGASNGVYAFYRVDPNEESLVIRETILYDRDRDEKNPWFYGTVAPWKWVSGDMNPIGEKEALKIIESYKHIPLELTAFENYVPQGTENWGGETVSGRRVLPSDGYAEGEEGDIMGTYFFDFTVNAAYVRDAYLGRSAGKGCELLAVEITVENTFGEALEMYDTDFLLSWEETSDDALTAPLTYYGEAFDDSVLPGVYNLRAGEKKTGFLIYEVPAGYGKFILYYLEEFDDDTTGDCYFVLFKPRRTV